MEMKLRVMVGVLVFILCIPSCRAKSVKKSPPQQVIVVVASTPSATPKPSATPTPVVQPRIPVLIRASHYWPPAGGHNCAYFVNGKCLSRMSSGEPWQSWIDRAASCPEEWPFGTTIHIEEKTWVCLDRGGRIEYDAGIPWVDFLTRYPIADYGDIIEGEIVFPLNGQYELPTPEPTCLTHRCLSESTP